MKSGWKGLGQCSLYIKANNSMFLDKDERQRRSLGGGFLNDAGRGPGLYTLPLSFRVYVRLCESLKQDTTVGPRKQKSNESS